MDSDGETADQLSEVKSVFNEKCTLPHDAQAIHEITDNIQNLLDKYKGYKSGWTTFQRAVYICRLMNCMLKKCPRYIFEVADSHGLFATMLSRVNDIFEDDNITDDQVEYFQRQFPEVNRLYEGHV